MEILLQGLRIAFAFCLYFLTLACYLAPILVVKCWGSRILAITSPDRAIRSRSLGLRVLSYCNCIAAGIFLAICFLVLIPYSNEKFKFSLTSREMKMKFPIPECVVVLGFLLTHLTEQIILTWKEHRDTFLQRDDLEQGQGLLEGCEMQELSDDPSAAQHENSENFLGDDNFSSNQHSNCTEDNHLCAAATSDDIEVAHACSHISLVTRRENVFMFYILALACALHSFFEGMALGLLVDVPKAVHLFIAIIFHECLISGALGISSMRLHYSFTSYLKFAAFLSSSIPFGLIVGIVMEKIPSTSGDILSGTFQSLVAGVFLHVVFQDIFPAQFFNRENRISKVFFISLGFLTITFVVYFVSKF